MPDPRLPVTVLSGFLGAGMLARLPLSIQKSCAIKRCSIIFTRQLTSRKCLMARINLSSINVSLLASALASKMAHRNHANGLTARRHVNGVSASAIASAIAVRLASQQLHAASGVGRRRSSASIGSRVLAGGHYSSRMAQSVASTLARKLTPQHATVNSLASSYSRHLASGSTHRIFASHTTRKLASAVVRRLEKPANPEADLIGLIASSIAKRSATAATAELPVNSERAKK